MSGFPLDSAEIFKSDERKSLIIEDRRAETFAQWLRQHPGVEIISRDRSKDYQRGATDGAPQAQQVIDRWHLLKNLREAIERFLSHTQLPEAASENAGLVTLPRQKRTSGERARSQGSRERRLALYQQVQELYRASRNHSRDCQAAPYWPSKGAHVRSISQFP